MKHYRSALVGAFLLLSPATAFADSTINISIRAHVDTFCRIYPPTENVINVRQGFAELGTVREICNTPQGYDVSTNFSNLESANLVVGGASYRVVNGIAVRSSSQPAVRNLAWSLNSATLSDTAQPVVMHVTITPR